MKNAIIVFAIVKKAFNCLLDAIIYDSSKRVYCCYHNNHLMFEVSHSDLVELQMMKEYVRDKK